MIETGSDRPLSTLGTGRITHSSILNLGSLSKICTS